MLSKKTVIIIAVCSAITFIIIVLVVASRYSPSSAPLPSIQPLSHHREHHLEQLQHSSLLRDTSSSQLSIPRIGEQNYSAVCLLPTTAPPSPDSRHHSPPSSNLPRSRSLGSHSTAKNSHNRHTPLRGVPHGPHSQVQIILPTPLALNVNASSSTLSIADKWVVSAGTPQQEQ